jgi:Rho-binding antiterminator
MMTPPLKDPNDGLPRFLEHTPLRDQAVSIRNHPSFFNPFEIQERSLPMTEPYQPISCDFHDELETLAVMRRKCAITYRDSSGEPVTVEDCIEDVYARDKEEFLKLKSGSVIRLDRLIEVDGKRLKDY